MCFNIYKSTISLLNTYICKKQILIRIIIINTGMDGT